MLITDYLPYAVAALAAAMVCAVIARYAWLRRQGTGIRYFALLMAALSWAALMSAIEYVISAHALPAKVFASQLYLVGGSMASVLAFLFAARYTQQDRWLTRRVEWLLWLPVIFELGLVFTNRWHTLYWPTISTTSNAPAARVVFGHGIITHVLAVFGYAMLVTAAGMLVWNALRAPAIYRRQSTLFVLAVLAPLITNIIYYFDLGPWQDFDFTPVTFALTGVLLALAVFRYQAVQLTPVALDTLFAHLRDGVLVVNKHDLIVNANPAANSLLSLPEDQLLGRALAELPEPWAQSLTLARRRSDAPQEVELQHTLPLRTIEVTSSTLLDRNSRSIGSTILLHDVTIHRTLQRNLAAANAELEDRVTARTAELATMRDSLAQHVANLSSHLSVLYEVILLGGETPDITAVRAKALDIVITSLAAQGGFIVVWDSAAGTGNVVTARHIDAGAVRQLATLPTEWLLGESAPHIVLNLAEAGVPGALRLPGMVACMTSSVQRRGVPVAALGIYWDHQPNLSVEAIALFRGLVDQLGILAENAHLQQVEHDALVQEERRRLARDLHDSVTQALYALALNAETTAKAVRNGHTDQLDERLNRIAAAARQALREMRLLLYELRLTSQPTMHLAEALLLRLDAVESRAGVQVQTEIDLELVLPGRWETDFYWIAIEALNNALKHAAANCIHVSLQRVDDTVRLEIEDDGIGMPPGEQDAQTVTGGMGLRSLHERATRVGGSLCVEPAALGGVAVRLCVPLPRTQAEQRAS
jgi:signal transduction histidine kinase